jgi:uncharacterized protein
VRAFGPDFWAAGNSWNYPLAKQQGFWRAIGLFVGLFVLFQLFQFAVGFGIFHFVFDGALSGLRDKLPSDYSKFLQASIMGMFPAALPIVILAAYLARFGLKDAAGRLPLRWPVLGFAGWAILIFGFGVSMALLSSGLYTMFNIDPLKELGLVEKTMADLAKDPKIFLLVLPSIVLAAPFAEEFLFRGILFAGLTNTAVGKTGAVVITSALWAVAHAGAAPWVNVGLIFLMGIILGIMLLRFGSLWVTIACHTAWNAMSSLTLLGIGGHS